METKGMFEVMDKLVEIETRKKATDQADPQVPGKGPIGKDEVIEKHVRYEVDRPEITANVDWTQLLTDIVKAAIGYTVNVTDDRLERCYTGELMYNRLDHHSSLGLIVEGPGAAFGIEDVVAIQMYFTEDGLGFDMRVGHPED